MGIRNESWEARISAPSSEIGHMFKAILKPDYERYEGVRPINIYLLRLLFLLIVVFVGSDSLSAILTHKGPWDHIRAAAVCMLAAYSILSIFALITPLKWL